MRKENAAQILRRIFEKNAEGEGGPPLRTDSGYDYGTVSSAVQKESPQQGERGLMNSSKTASILSKTFHKLANR